MTTSPPHDSEIELKLPIAPIANHRLLASAEGKLLPALTAAEAVAWLKNLQQGGHRITRVDLHGPGDVLASWDAADHCLQLLQQEVPHTPLSLTCLGIGGAALYPDLLRFGVSRVTLLIDTVNSTTAAGLYAWIRPGRKNLPLKQGIELLIKEQAETVQSLSHAGIRVVIQTTVQQGINDGEIAAVARKTAELGASAMEIICAEQDGKELVRQAQTWLKTTVVQPSATLPVPGGPESCNTALLPTPTADRPNVAVASSNGMEVDLHLGQAGQLLIYGPRGDGLACLLETRPAPAAGAPERWQALAGTLSDCFVVLASHAGQAPRQQMAEQGVKVILSDDQVEGLVDVLYGGGKQGNCKVEAR